MEFNPAARRSAIEGALREYQRTPGKHAQGQRQPSLLFAWINEILLLASGRSIDGEKGRLPDAALQQCACFFVLRALLFPGADHYSLLGLDRHADAGEIKNRYRQMMRLLHPDFAGSSGVAKWPADAATRVNQAYEVLSSSVQRRSYDEQFETEPVRSAPAAGQAGPARIMPAHPHARARAAIEDPRRRLKRLATAFGAAGGLVLVAAWMANAPSDKASLVQRADLPPRPVVAVAPVSVGSPALPALEPAPTPAVEPLPALVPALAVAEPAPSLPPMLARQPVPAAPQTTAVAVAVAQPPVGRAATSAMSAPAATNVPQPEPVAVAPVIAAPPAPAVAEPASPSPTLADVHPLIAKLLQEMESGYGDRMVGLLEREARSAPGAQELLSHYNGLVDGMRPVRLSKVQLKAEPQNGRLLVTGHLLVHVSDRTVAPRELAVQAEFASRNGAVVMTRLARARE